MKNFYAIVLALIILVLVIVVATGERSEESPAYLLETEVQEFLAQEINPQMYGFSRFGNRVAFSSDGRYMVVNGFSTEDGRTYETQYAVVDLKDLVVVHTGSGSIVDLNKSHEYFLVNEVGDGAAAAIVYFETGDRIHLSEEPVYRAAVSPDGSLLATTSSAGAQLFDTQTWSVQYHDTPRHAFSIWFSDSDRLFGFYDTETSLGDGAYEYRPTIFSIETESWEQVPIVTDRNTFKRARWIVPDRHLFITAGFDDGAFEYVADLENNSSTFLRETSGLFGSIGVIGEQLLLISGDGYTLYDKSGEVISEGSLLEAQSRDTPIDLKDGRALYAIRHGTGEVDIATFSLDTAGESVLQTVEKSMSPVILGPMGHSALILTTENIVVVPVR